MSITVTASQLQKRSPRVIALKRELAGVLQRINKEILIAARAQQCNIIYAPLLHFSIPEMSNKDAQSLIFGQVIELLEEKEFDIELTGTGDDFKFNITWDVRFSKRDVNRYHTILLKHHKNIKSARLNKEDLKQQYLKRMRELIELTEKNI